MDSNKRAPSPSDDELDMMLAGGQLGGPAKDRIFEAVTGQVLPRRPFFSLRSVLSAGLLVAGAAAALLLMPRTRDDGFTAKGGPGAGGPSVEISCAGGTLNACPIGSRLLFAVEGAGTGYLAAYADPAHGGQRIWYFSRDGQSPALSSEPGTQVAPRAILVGSEHTPGDYLVQVLVTSEPLSRAQLAQAPATIARRQFSLRVVPPARLVDPF
jgi:hypothetical protein